MTFLDFLHLYYACGVAVALGMAVRGIRRVFGASAGTMPQAPAPIPLSLAAAFVSGLVFCACIILAGLTWPLHVTKVFADDTSR